MLNSFGFPSTEYTKQEARCFSSSVLCEVQLDAIILILGLGDFSSWGERNLECGWNNVTSIIWD